LKRRQLKDWGLFGLLKPNLPVWPYLNDVAIFEKIAGREPRTYTNDIPIYISPI
jgi:hypothetical protein